MDACMYVGRYWLVNVGVDDDRVGLRMKVLVKLILIGMPACSLAVAFPTENGEGPARESRTWRRGSLCHTRAHKCACGATVLVGFERAHLVTHKSSEMAMLLSGSSQSIVE